MLKKLYSQAAQKDPEAKRAISLFVFVARVRETSTITYREHDCREAIERNEAYEAFSAAGDEKKKPSLKVRLGLDWLILDYLTDP